MITDGQLTPGNFKTRSDEVLELIKAAIDKGINCLQVREKNLGGGMLYDLVLKVKAGLRGEIPVLVNERLDVALAAGADGVHLPEKALPTAVARRLAGNGFLIGRSIHSKESLAEEIAGDADYFVFGPVFATPGKGEGRGIQALGEIIRAAEKIPVIAVGGVDFSNAEEILKQGAAGWAAIRCFARQYF